MSICRVPARRNLLASAGKLVVVGAFSSLVPSAFAASSVRRLQFEHLHTGETISLAFAVGNRYLPSALTALNNFLRDHYTGEVGAIDPQLFDLLFRTSQELGCREPFQVISGYRCPTTNNSLRLAGGGGVARQSLHMEGKAIDVRLPGVALEDLRDAAISLQGGGVGFYAREQFVHLDTGRIRSW
ncbi:MAG: DUF882 domain-containing protein [Candidatus Accumulibacter sp.]|uniref:YcbK family protein n=1 Tax=Accumulibacter sp. TaxID=2053492 RepID=UPI00287873D7|nr:DUF882 domain-containing protein [Accumulibacter sp.]MDS4013262.1 DUF882 domain-containing protein [Accumulibacter sp.]